MKDPKLWKLLSNHLTEEESESENRLVLLWLKQSNKNLEYFKQFKMLQENPDTALVGKQVSESITLREKFSLQRIKVFVLEQALGNLVGFVIGMWVVSSFTHKVLERRSIHNLFGLDGRKEVLVNDIPSWLQSVLAIMIGFIVLELISHFFKAKKYLLLWEMLRGLNVKAREED